jgi:hypothetical protein
MLFTGDVLPNEPGTLSPAGTWLLVYRHMGHRSRTCIGGPILDLNPLERARTERKLAPGFLVRSAPKPRRVVDRVGA